MSLCMFAEAFLFERVFVSYSIQRLKGVKKYKNCLNAQESRV